MTLPEEAVRLTVHIGENDHAGGRPLYEALVLAAREHDLAGATVLRAGMGYGGSSRLHTGKILRLSGDLPLVVEMVDTRERIDAFLPALEDLLGETSAMVTVEPVHEPRCSSPSSGRNPHP